MVDDEAIRATLQECAGDVQVNVTNHVAEDGTTAANHYLVTADFETF